MSLQVWLPLNGNLENQGLDGWKPSGTGITYNNNGKIGKARSAGAITIPADVCARVFNNSGMSIAFWVYINLDDGATNNITMFFGNNRIRWFGLFNYPTANDFHWHWANTPKGGSYSGTAGVTTVSSGIKRGILPTKKWIHIAVTCDNKFFTMYLNGEQQIHQACNPMNVADYSQDTLLVSNNSNYYYNDYRIYDHCLSPKEVKELSKGLVLHYRLAGPGRTNLLTGTGPNDSGWNVSQSGGTATKTVTNDCTTFNVTAKATQWFLYSHNLPASIRSSLKTNTIYTYSFETKSTANFNFNISIKCPDGKNQISNEKTVSIIGDNEWHKYSVQLTTIASFSSISRTDQSFYMSGGNVISTVSFRNAKFEEGSIATPWCPNPSDALYNAMGYNIEYDCSGYCRNGTKSGTITWDTNSPRYTTSYKWPAATSAANRIISQNCTFDGKGITMAVWVKFTGTTAGGGNYHMPLESSNPGYYEMSVDTSGSLRAGIYVNGTRYVENCSNPSMYDNKWHHIAITYDGFKICRYVDGKAYIQTNVTGTANGLDQAFYIGSYGTKDSYYNNNIWESDARVYTTALSADDIAELYHTSAMVDNQNNLYAYEYVEE